MSKQRNTSTVTPHWITAPVDGRVRLMLGDGERDVLTDPGAARIVDMGADEAIELARALKRAADAVKPA